MSAAPHVPITDLTLNELGDVNPWIGQGKKYHDVLAYVSKELCRRTSALPTETSLLPSPLLPVIHLLDFPTPPITQSLPGINAELIFSHNIATHTSSECLRLPAPSHDLLKVLRSCSGQAMLDGKVSVQHWDNMNIFLPFDALGTWGLIVDADTAKKTWRRALRWLDQQQEIPTQYIARVMKLLGAVPWNDSVKGLGSGLSIVDMAVFLSQEWLSDAHLDSMLSATVSLRCDALTHITPRTEIVLSDFMTHILASPSLETSPIPCDYVKKAPKSVQKLGSVISESSPDIRVATISFSPPGHWACLIIDCRAGTIGWGDSAGRTAPAGLEKRLKAWLGIFSPQIKFAALHTLPCAHQPDGYSCGIISVNTLKHNVFGDKLWNVSCRETLRVAEFLDILEISEGCTATPWAKADPIARSTPPPLAPTMPVQADTFSSDLRTAQSSPLEAPQVQSAKRPSSPSSILLVKTKHPRNLAYPPPHLQVQTPKQVSEPISISKQAAAKRKVNEHVLNGTFVHDPKRWDQYKRKLAQLDPNFEVSEDPRLVCQVKHSICGAWFVMAAPYAKDRFKNHVSSCSYSTRGGGMKSLVFFGIVAKNLSASSSTSSLSSALSFSPGPSSLPCPGLTEKDSPSLCQYFTRTAVASAGGEDLHSVAQALFSDEFKNLSSDKKDLVRLKQKQTHTWSIDHLMKTIHAIGKAPCEGNAEVASDGSKSLRACKRCRALLTLHAFKNAISRKPAQNKNRAYIPHIYQPAAIGKMYSLGFNDLVDGVSARLDV
ncbi:hypothetical protein V8E53_003025 [Lactarius tabidus]